MRIILLLYYAIYIYDMVTSMALEINWYSYVDSFPNSFTSRVVKPLFENFKDLGDIQATMMLLLCILNVCQVLSRAANPLFGNLLPRFTLRQDTNTWHGVRENKLTCNVGTQTPATGIAAESEGEPVLVSVAPVYKKTWKRKSARLVRDEEAPSRREQEEEEEGLFASC